MKELVFEKKGYWYICEPLQGGETGVLIVHINFGKDTKVIVERTIDESLGWAVVASRNAAVCYEETITGVLGGTQIRIKCENEPTVAKYVSL